MANNWSCTLKDEERDEFFAFMRVFSRNPDWSEEHPIYEPAELFAMEAAFSAGWFGRARWEGR